MLASLFGSLVIVAGFAAEPSSAEATDMDAPWGRVVAGSGVWSGCNATESGMYGPVEDEALSFGEPVDVAIGPGSTLYVLDRGCARVTLVPLSGTEGSGTVVAAGKVGGFLDNLQDAQALHADAATGELHIADTINQRIVRWRPGDSDGKVIVRGEGRTDNGDLAYPSGVFVIGGDLYVVEQLNHRVQKFELASCCADSGRAVGMTLFGCPELFPPYPPPAICAKGYDVSRMREPRHIFITPLLDFYVADTLNHRVLRFNINDTRANEEHDFSNFTVDSAVVAGTTGIPGCGPEQLRLPTGVAVDEDGFLYVGDTGNHRIQKFAPLSGERVGITVAGECCCPRVAADGSPLGGSGLHQLSDPMGIALDGDSGALLVADRGNRRVMAFGNAADSPHTHGVSCAYGVDCTALLTGVLSASAGNQVLIARRNVEVPNGTRNEANMSGPCGSSYCSIPSWPGLVSPQAAQGVYFDTYHFGVPRGPPNNESSALGEYVLCFGHNPSTPCVAGMCGGGDNCTNSSSWLCAGVEPFGIRRKVWEGVPGTEVASLQSWPSFPDAPDLDHEVDAGGAFEAPLNWGDNYGQTLTGLFSAPETGEYTFHLTSDRNSELWVSDVFNETGRLIAWISENEVWYEGGFLRTGFASGPDDWTRFGSQSGTAELNAGQLYWLEALHKESVGLDHLLVGVTLPSGTVHKPIPAAFFQAKVCAGEAPSGLGVVHDCHGRSTAQTCVAECAGGFVGERRTFHCDGTGQFVGLIPSCTPVTCKEYGVEVGPFFMHGMVDSRASEGPCHPDDRFCLWHVGPGSAATSSGVHVDAQSRVVMLDTRHHVVVRWNGVRHQTLAGGRGAGSAADQLNSPLGVFFALGPLPLLGGSGGGDGGAALFVADTWNHRIVRWQEGATAGEVVLGTGLPGHNLTELRYPTAVVVDGNGSLYVADYGNNRLLMLEAGASKGKLIVDKDGEPDWASATMPTPSGAETFFDGRGNYYSADYGAHRLSACLRSTQCSFHNCRQTDHLAEYGPGCGCTQDNIYCAEAHGSFPGGMVQPTVVRQPAL